MGRTTIEERLQLRPDVFIGHTTDGRSWVVAWPVVEELGKLDRASVRDAGNALVGGLLDQLAEADTLGWPVAEQLGRLNPAQGVLVRRLAGSPDTTAVLQAAVRAEDGAELVTGLLDQLWEGGWLAMVVTCDGRPVYSLLPNGRPPAPPAVLPPGDLVLSRFTLVHREDRDIAIESSRAWCEIRLHEPAALGALAGSPSRTGTSGPSMTPLTDASERLWRELWWAGMAVAPSDSEETDLALRQWSPHELWFHYRTRIAGRRPGGGFGKTQWARGAFDPLPAQHEPFSGPVVKLRRPDLEGMRATDPSMTAVLEDRRTIRSHDDSHPLTVEQLGEFLFRCARNRWKVELGGVEYLSRPYPAASSVHELELYPVVRHVEGLDQGIYHYDPQEHRLELVSGQSVPVRRMLHLAAVLADTAEQPQTLLVVAARFGRLMWLYQDMPYALIMKHVGVLYQTMYTVATAMGLAPCGLGTGDSAAFAEATGLNPFAESSVGEFMLGSRQSAPASSGVVS